MTDQALPAEHALPQPTSERWKPLRSGLINLFHYADEQFWYEDGRMLLRGNNGTGKSRVLALQLPFLLDAEVSPTRMEPDRSASKRPEWNLLLGGKHRDRLGYTWIEFARDNEDGECEFLTLGCGLHAVEHRGGIDSWFFTTTARVGLDLELVVDSVPLAKSRLPEVLGDQGQMYRTQGDYRRSVDEKLFRLGGRYRSLIDLLIQLRVPQLSRDFDEQRMNAQLSSALPPLSVDVLTQVADAMRDLDEERDRLEELRRSALSVQNFRDQYRQYLRIALKRRVIDLSSMHNRYERTLRSINEDRRQHDEAIASHRQAEEKQAAAETDRTTIRATLDALRSRPEMDDAKRLDDLRTDCDKLTRQSTAATEHVGHAQQKLQTAEKQFAEESELVKWDTKRTQSRFDGLQGVEVPARVQRSLREVTPNLINDPDASKLLDRVVGATNTCIKAARTLMKHRDEIDQRSRALERQIDRQADCEARLEVSVQQLADRTNALLSARDELRGALIAWFDQAQLLSAELPDRQHWLELLADEFSDELDDGEERDSLDSSLLDAVAEPIRSAIDNVSRRLTTRHHQLDALVEQLEAAIDDLEQRRQSLIDGVHVPPPPPHFRNSEARNERAGGPLYELCDFVNGIPDHERPNWEAALEASGLLDAWVTPNGQLEAPELADVTLLSGEPIANDKARLSCVLQPSESLPDSMSADVVRRLLMSIGCGKGSGNAWVDRDGTWQLGPARGAWSKTEVQYIGATAREIRRKQQITELEKDLANARDELKGAESNIQAVQQDQATLDGQRRSVPSDDRLRQAMAARRESDSQRLQSQEALNEQLARVGEARAAVESATARLERDAADLDLTDWVKRLAELEDSLQTFRHETELLRRDLESLRQRMTSAERARDNVNAATDLLEKERHQAKQFSDELAAKTAQLKTLESSVGKDVQMILDEIESAKLREASVETELKSLQSQVIECVGKREKLAGKLEQAEQILARHEDDRLAAINRVAAMAENGLADQALEAVDSEQPALEFPDAPWSPTRAAQLAKQIRAALRDTVDSDAAWDTAQNDIQLQFRALEQSLLPTGITPQSQTHDEAWVVSIPFQGVACSPSHLSKQMADEVRHREVLITDRERELFEQRLIGDIAQSLHRNIRDADELCSRMNKEVESRPMSTGMRLRFRWHAVSDGSDELKIACKSLLQKPSAMSDDDRTALGQFLQQRIAEARSRDDVGTWQQHLADALDYRSWFTFDIDRETDGKWQRLTKRTHGTGSGGERAVALIIPMLAALAAYYQSADKHAPRIILMDEAFVGIDNEMRAKFMDLMVQFDLDFMMTSEREWGCYPTMPALAIYHLSTRRGVDAILPTRWVWNGNGRTQSDVHDLPRQIEMFVDEL